MYLDAFLLAVPTKNLQAYKKMAKLGCKVWMKHGALSYVEAVGDDVAKNEWSDIFFPGLLQLKKNETAVIAFITFKNKKHRDTVNKKVHADPEMSPEKWENSPMPFDMVRMAYGGFEALVNN